MKFGAVCVILVVGLIVQVTIFGLRIDGSFFFVFGNLQSNEVDGIFWQFIRPFLPNGYVVTSGSTTGTASGSSAGTAAANGSGSSMTLGTGDLNQSNVILNAGGTSSLSNVSQNFGGSSNGTSM